MNQNIVIETSSNIRAIARVSLQGKWTTAVLATAVYLVALMVPSAILDGLFGGSEGVSALSSLYSLLVTAPFTVGYSLFCINLFRRRECEVAQVFYGFEQFFKALGLYMVMCIFITLWSLLLIVPGIIAAYRYSQCFLIMVDRPELSIMECLAESKRLMAGNKLKLFCMEFSFIGWAILASIPVTLVTFIFAFGGMFMANIGAIIGCVGFLWLTPYMCVAGVAFYDLANGNLKPGVIEGDVTVTVDIQQTGSLPNNNPGSPDIR